MTNKNVSENQLYYLLKFIVWYFPPREPAREKNTAGARQMEHY